MKTLSIINQKGGVGKSTTAFAVGAGLKAKGYRILYVDIDPQGNLSYTLGGDINGYNVYGVLQRPETIAQELQHVEAGDLLASSAFLAGADTTITETGKEYRLKEALERVQGDYDYCIIDTPPALGILTVNALTASNTAIIPVQADMYSLHGVIRLYSSIEVVRKYCNPSLTIEGILLTRFNARSIVRRELAEQAEATAKQLNTKVFNTRIRECTALVESQVTGQSIYDYAPRSNASKDYQALVEEIVKGE